VQYLEHLASGNDATLYTVEGEFDGPVKRYVVTTPETRAICNQPELLGVDFGHQLARASARALQLLPERDSIAGTRQERVCVVHFLRGGLNFGLREGLFSAYGFNRHASCFMSSQRRKVDGRWQVEEDMYRKLHIPRHAVLMVGDVVATGITVDNGLGVILDHLKEIGSSVRRLVFFTIGCHKLEKVLEKYHQECAEAFEEFEGSTAVYFEGKFKLVDSQTDLKIGIPGTDLIRKDCQLAPEFALSQYERLAYPLERCTIYDAGSRAFDIPGYLTDVRHYWRKVSDLADEGMTLTEALHERWPEPWRDAVLAGDHKTYEAECRRHWPGVERLLLDQLWEKTRLRWSPEFVDKAGHSSALAELAHLRLRELAVVGE